MTALDIAAEAIDASFDEWGIAATYQPPTGAAIGCVVLRDARRQAQPEEFTSKPKTSGWTFRVRKSEVAAPAVGGRFVIGAESYAVTGSPHFEDPDALVWLCEVL